MSLNDDQDMDARVQADADADDQAQSECEQAEAEQNVAPPRVSHISVSRLFNLGNYENVKFDVSVEIPPGNSACATMKMLLGILQKLRPIKVGYDVTHAIEMLNKPETELTEAQLGLLAEYKATVEAHNKKVQERKQAMAKLDALGGTRTDRDAKDEWEDHDEEYYEG